MTEQELAQLGSDHPIAVTLDAQDIGRMHAARYTPDQFMAELMEKFRAAGAPVEGVIQPKFAHGKLARVKDHPQGPGCFGYVWLPENYVNSIMAMGGFN